MEFSRLEYWSVLPFPSPNISLESESGSHSVMSNSLQPHGLYTVHGILQARILEWVAFPFSRGCSHPGIEPRSPALQVDSLPAEPQGKPKNPGVGGLSNQGLLHSSRFLSSWAIREAPVLTDLEIEESTFTHNKFELNSLVWLPYPLSINYELTSA